MPESKPAVTEWDEAEQREETSATGPGRFLEQMGAALWPIVAMALIFIAVVVWAFIHYG